MREIVAKKITETVKSLCIEANTSLPDDVIESLNKALSKEESPNGREILRQLINNAKVAWRDKLPLCQDTGAAVVFIELGQDVHIIGGNLLSAINEGVVRGYNEGFLRKSMVHDPLTRINTNDNTPAIVHVAIVPGEQVKIQFLAKGGGVENCSTLKMFLPSSSKEEINKFILETVEKAGPNPCPPIIVGIGIGGTFDSVTTLAKKALLRELGRHSSNKETAEWEKELLEIINNTGIGPMGLGGTTTALAVNVEKFPCHISSLPVAVNIECHSHRHREALV